MSDRLILELDGLDGANPLAFMAALGVLRAFNRSCASPGRLSWTDDLHPLLTIHEDFHSESLSENVCSAIKQIEADGVAAFGDIVGVSLADFREFLSNALLVDDPHVKSIRATFAAAYGSDAVIDKKKGTVVPTALSFSNGQGGKLLLKDFRTLANRVTPEKVYEALFVNWQYLDLGQPTFRWDPLDMRTGAHMATDPGTTDTRSVIAGNVLAFIGLSFFPVVPVANQLRTSGLRNIDGVDSLAWPLWKHPLPEDVIFSLLQQTNGLDGLGVFAQFASRRLMYKKNLYLGPSVAI